MSSRQIQVWQGPRVVYGLGDEFVGPRWADQASDHHILLGHGVRDARCARWIKTGIFLADAEERMPGDPHGSKLEVFGSLALWLLVDRQAPPDPLEVVP